MSERRPRLSAVDHAAINAACTCDPKSHHSMRCTNRVMRCVGSIEAWRRAMDAQLARDGGRNDAREKAVERLARRLIETIDFSRTNAEQARYVDELLRDAGFVAVDEHLRARVRTAGLCGCALRSAVPGMSKCDACAAKVALADAVLAQLGGKP